MIGFIAGLFVGAFLGSVAMAVMAYRKHVALEAEIERADDASDYFADLLNEIEDIANGAERVRTSRILEVLNRD